MDSGSKHDACQKNPIREKIEEVVFLIQINEKNQTATIKCPNHTGK